MRGRNSGIRGFRISEICEIQEVGDSGIRGFGDSAILKFVDSWIRRFGFFGIQEFRDVGMQFGDSRI